MLHALDTLPLMRNAGGIVGLGQNFSEEYEEWREG